PMRAFRFSGYTSVSISVFFKTETYGLYVDNIE
ncbi:uncharacterized protein METZ01_LOCUS338376, partial [marine metagenome]